MKIVDIAVKKVYRFNCPNCQSRLEADSKEVVDIGGKVCKFHCPVLTILSIHLNSSLHGYCLMRKKVIIHVRILVELPEPRTNSPMKRMTWKLNEQLMRS